MTFFLEQQFDSIKYLFEVDEIKVLMILLIKHY